MELPTQAPTHIHNCDSLSQPFPEGERAERKSEEEQEEEQQQQEYSSIRGCDMDETGIQCKGVPWAYKDKTEKYW